MRFMDWVFKVGNTSGDEAISGFGEWLQGKINGKKKLIFPDEDTVEKWAAFVKGNSGKGSAGTKNRAFFRIAWQEYLNAANIGAEHLVVESDKNVGASKVFVESAVLRVSLSLGKERQQKEEVVKICKFETEPARTSLSLNVPVRVDEFLIPKINIGFSLPHYIEESGEAYAIVCNVVKERVDYWVSFLGGEASSDCEHLVIDDVKQCDSTSACDVSKCVDRSVLHDINPSEIRRGKVPPTFTDEELGIGQDRDLFSF